MDLCLECETVGLPGSLLVCSGTCARRFHPECIGDTEHSAGSSWTCPECVVAVHRCFSCRQYANDSALVLCSKNACGRRCHSSEPCFSGLVSKSISVCGAHRCHALACASTSSSNLMRCTRCPLAYHDVCMPLDAHILSDNSFYCVHHVTQVGLPGALDATAATAAAASNAGKRRERGDTNHPAAIKRVRVQDVVAEQNRQALVRQRAEADAAKAKADREKTAAAAVTASRGFSLASAVAEIHAAKSFADSSSSSGITIIPQPNPGRGRGALLSARRVAHGSAVTWQPHALISSAPQQNQQHGAHRVQHHQQHDGSTFNCSHGDYSEFGNTSTGGSHSEHWMSHAPPSEDYGSRQLPELTLTATSSVDTLGRQIFCDALGACCAMMCHAPRLCSDAASLVARQDLPFVTEMCYASLSLSPFLSLPLPFFLFSDAARLWAHICSRR
jgi:hypothetical protein